MALRSDRSLRAMAGLVCALAVVGATRADAQQYFDDFEGPLLESDGGVWTGLQPFSNVAIGTAAVAARSGLRGLRVVDSNVALASHNMAYVWKDFTGTGDRFVRFWYRPSASTGGPAHIASIAGDIRSVTIMDATWEPAAGAVSFGCSQGTAASSSFAGTVGPQVLSLNSWHLVEFATIGLGTANGRCMAWVDGMMLPSRDNLSWSTLHYLTVLLGEHYRDNPFAGEHQFDNAGLADVAPASSLQFVAPEAFVEGTCTPVLLRAINSYDGGLTNAGHQVPVRLLMPDAGLELMDQTCTTPQNHILVLNDFSLLSVKSLAAGPAYLVTDSLDLVNATLMLTVLPTGADAGVPDAGVPDAGVPDAGVPDAGVPDAGVPDAGVPDAGVPDAGVPDAGVPDAGVPDAGVPDAGVPDAGVPDAGVPDAGVPDAGVPDAGVHVTDGGSDSGPLVVQCGCHAVGDLKWALALCALALRRRGKNVDTP